MHIIERESKDFLDSHVASIDTKDVEFIQELLKES